MLPFDTPHTAFYYLSIVTMSLSCTVSEILRDTGRKSPIFHTPPAFGAPVGVTQLEFHQVPLRQKSRVL